MLDTVRVGFNINLANIQNEKWKYRLDIDTKGREKEVYTKYLSVSYGAWIKVTYNPPNYIYHLPMLQYELSLPKISWGNNVKLIQNEAQKEEAISIANRIVCSKGPVPDIDLGTGKITRIDIAHDHQVGDDVNSYIRALHNLEYPRRDTLPYRNQGVQYKSGRITTKFYDKERQSHDPMAHGILRQETTIRSSCYIRDQLGMEPPVLKNMRVDMSHKILIADLERLGLYNNPIGGRDFVQDTLVNKYGFTKGTNLLGYWLTRQTKTREQLILEGVYIRTIQQKEKDIRDAGIPLTTTESEIPLAALVI